MKTVKGCMAAAALTVLTCSFSLVYAQPVSAPLWSYNSEKCVFPSVRHRTFSDNGKSLAFGADPVTQKTCPEPERASSKWYFAGHEIKNAETGYCLEPRENKQGSKVYTATCSGDKKQQWSFDAQARLKYADSNLCLDVNRASKDDGAQLILWTCHNHSNQKWGTRLVWMGLAGN